MPGLRIWQRCDYARVTQGVEYALIMLNMIEYASIYLKKPSAEVARILNISNAGVYN